MILQIGARPRKNVERQGARAFTLIEFILVMTILLVVFGVSIPTLSRFFQGRTLDYEARRFVSLTRYAQSRAVSESVPMILWIDAREGEYGLEREYGYEKVDPRGLIYQVDPDLQFEFINASSRSVSLYSIYGRKKLPGIRFQPDGFIPPGSPDILIRERDHPESELWISRSRNPLNYEIQTNVFQTIAR